MDHETLIKQIPVLLLEWYGKNARDLPWRKDPQPYYIWVSEIMLQQTRVEAVIDYYKRFLTLFPTVEILASADEQSLLKAWEGLGYYNRVRNMKKAASIIATQYAGRLPDSYEELRKLPGIGDYTAGAVLSIAYGIPLPAVDGNVLRVYSRIFGSFENIADSAVKEKVKGEIKAMIPADHASDFNQSLMELGATICLPNGFPYCESCPVAQLCKAKAENLQLELPLKTPKKERTAENRTVLLIIHKNRVCLHKREKDKLLGGMWEFPGDKDISPEELLQAFGIPYDKIRSAGKAKHIFTHIEWHMQGFAVYTEADTLPSGFVWADMTELNNLFPLPSAFKFYRDRLDCLWEETV